MLGLHEIHLSKEFNKEYVKIQALAEKGKQEEKYLLGLISKAISVLSQDKEAGKKIPKKLWPKEYIIKYDITNLWKYNLDTYWRLIYTISGNEIQFFLICLDFVDHKEYNKKFNYSSR